MYVFHIFAMSHDTIVWQAAVGLRLVLKMNDQDEWTET